MEAVDVSVKYGATMSQENRLPTGRGIPRDEISATQLFAVLAHERRQQVLAYLSRRTGAVLLGDLAAYLASGENNASTASLERVLIDLHHSHLPLMRERGVLEYDVDSRLVSLNCPPDTLRPFLDLVES